MEKYEFKLKVKEDWIHLDSSMVPDSVVTQIVHEILHGRFSGTVMVAREGRIGGGTGG